MTLSRSRGCPRSVRSWRLPPARTRSRRMTPDTSSPSCSPPSPSGWPARGKTAGHRRSTGRPRVGPHRTGPGHGRVRDGGGRQDRPSRRTRPNRLPVVLHAWHGGPAISPLTAVTKGRTGWTAMSVRNVACPATSRVAQADSSHSSPRSIAPSSRSPWLQPPGPANRSRIMRPSRSRPERGCRIGRPRVSSRPGHRTRVPRRQQRRTRRPAESATRVR